MITGRKLTQIMQQCRYSNTVYGTIVKLIPGWVLWQLPLVANWSSLSLKTLGKLVSQFVDPLHVEFTVHLNGNLTKKSCMTPFLCNPLTLCKCCILFQVAAQWKALRFNSHTIKSSRFLYLWINYAGYLFYFICLLWNNTLPLITTSTTKFSPAK